MCPSGQAIVANNTVVNGSSVGCELVLPMRMLTQLLCLNVRVRLSAAVIRFSYFCVRSAGLLALRRV
jgi:hypothetical protein